MAEPKFVRNLSDNKASTIAGVLVYLSKEAKHPLAFIYNEDPWRLLLLALRNTHPYIKWQKNLYRFFFVILCAVIAWGGADDLDKFVALVGNFACIPLVYIYPPLLHYKAVAKNRLWKISDIVLCIFGFVAMAYTTTLTVYSWAGGSSEPTPPGYCDRRGH
ncbi:hypothetical protein CH063_03692 [Colletotrichum higginsianum]|uniref:Amino acid transporter transmembrane domain-containing protein n=1 Tax=Colletotrichum higginsianum (strain IMI 349063) TaxID=759273 RepID=H1VZW4_COLHI|nr:hypothetical protein CH063_03692 [Colletotrichum higginsianum]